MAPALFSNLYPATAGVMALPLAGQPWERFVPLWRRMLLAGALVAGAAGGLASARGRWAPLAGAAGAWMAVALFPVTRECVVLGQVNLLIGAILGLCMACAARGWTAPAAVLAVAGAGVKLVPCIALWPLAAARRWKALIAAGVAGSILIGVTWAFVPLPRLAAGVLATLRFQASIMPDWLGAHPAGPRILELGSLRHGPMALWTVALAGLCAATAGRSPAVIAAAMALGAAWLGADAAAFHVLYAPLYLPAVAFLALWPLEPHAPAWSWGLAPLAAAPMVLYGSNALTPVEARMVIAGEILWLGVAARMVWEAGLSRRWWAGIAAGLMVTFAVTAWMAHRPLPPLPPGARPLNHPGELMPGRPG